MLMSFQISFKIKISIQIYMILIRHFILDQVFNPEIEKWNELHIQGEL